MWGSYEPRTDGAIGGALLDVISLSRPAVVIAVSGVNSLLLGPVWFGIGFAVARLSRGAVLLFVAIALGGLMPGVTRQLAHSFASQLGGRLLLVQLAVFGLSISGFVFATLFGAACGLGRGHEPG